MSRIDGTTLSYVPGEGSQFYVKTSWDMQPNIDSAAALRSAGLTGDKEKWHVARIDKRLLHKLITEAGIRWDDTEAVRDHIDKLLNDGTLSKLRVHEGSF